MLRLKHKRSSLALALLLLILGACSSSKPKEAENADVVAVAEEAGTDIVPQASIETPETAETSPMPEAESHPEPEKQTQDQTSEPTSPKTSPDAPTSKASQKSGVIQNYTVHHGETLMKIAFDTYGDLYKWKDIYQANKAVIQNPNFIPKGVVLKIEKPAKPVSIQRNGEKYLIKTGDTLGKISNALYGDETQWKRIWKNNKQLIHDPNKIFSGFYLYYVPQTTPPPSTKTAISPQPNNP